MHETTVCYTMSNRCDWDVLSGLLESDPMSAIAYFEFLLAHNDFNNIDEFRARYSETECRQCTRSYMNEMLWMHCRDCSHQSRNACICLKCFNAGMHEGHRVAVIIARGATCDCGDASIWKKEGFCCEHSGLDSNTEVVFPKCKELFVDIVGLIFRLFTANKTSIVHRPALRWISSFMKLGDSFRRMVALGLAEKGHLDELLLEMVDLDEHIAADIVDIMNSMNSDPYFSVQYAAAFFRVHRQFQVKAISPAGYIYTRAVGPLGCSLFHCFHLCPINENMKRGFDFGEFVSTFVNDIVVKLASLIKQGMPRCMSLPTIDEVMYGYMRMHLYDIDDKCKAAMTQKCFDTVARSFRDKNSVFTVKLNAIPDELEGLVFLVAHVKNMWTISRSLEINPSTVFKEGVGYWKEVMTGLHMKIEDTGTSVNLLPCADSMVHGAIMRQRGKVRETVDRLCRDNDISGDVFCIGSIFQSLHLEALTLSDHGTELPRGLLVLTYHLRDSSYEMRYRCEAVQMTMGLVSNKEMYAKMMLTMILNCSQEHSAPVIKSVRFIFLYRLLGYVCDRTLHERAHTSTWRECIVWMLHMSRVPVADIERTVPAPEQWKACKFRKTLDGVGMSLDVSGKKVYELRSESLWNPVCVYADICSVRTALTKWINGHRGKLLPFHPWTCEMNGYELRSVLNTQTVRSVIYAIVSDFVEKHENSCEIGLHVALGVLSYACDDSVILSCSDCGDVLCASSVDELRDVLPSDMSFMAFMKRKIKFSGRRDVSLFDMIVSLGDLGCEFMSKIGVVISSHVAPKVDYLKAKRETAKRRRAAVLNDHRLRALSFSGKNDQPDDVGTAMGPRDNCLICSFDNEKCSLGYPVAMCFTHIPVGFDGFKEWHAIIGFRLCQHKVHGSCTKDGPFRCAMDRYHRNNVLPDLIGCSDLSECDLASLGIFVRRFEAFAKNGLYDSFIGSLSGLIVVFDLRLRSFPDSVDAPKYGILSRCLFWSVWHSIHCGLCSVNELTEVNVFRKFIVALCNSSPLSDVDSLIKSHLKSIGDDAVSAFKFLRLAVLTKHFCLGLSVSSTHGLIQWDVVLSCESLSTLYNISLDIGDYSLPEFSLIHLPRCYTDLAKPEYNVPVERCDENLAISLTDGVILCYQGDSNEYTSTGNYIKGTKNGFMMLMLLGLGATVVHAFECTAERSVSRRPSFYLDSNGESDIGFSRGHMMYLSEVRYGRLADDVLSGECFEQPVNDS